MADPRPARRSTCPKVAAALILCALGGTAAAQDAGIRSPSYASPRSLAKGEARVVSVFNPFETVIVGDPAVIATSVVSDTRLVLTARAAGRTNIILLGADGEVQARWDVIVSSERGHRATVHRGTAQTSVLCDPVCRPVRDLENTGP